MAAMTKPQNVTKRLLGRVERQVTTTNSVIQGVADNISMEQDIVVDDESNSQSRKFPETQKPVPIIHESFLFSPSQKSPTSIFLPQQRPLKKLWSLFSLFGRWDSIYHVCLVAQTVKVTSEGHFILH